LSDAPLLLSGVSFVEADDTKTPWRLVFKALNTTSLVEGSSHFQRVEKRQTPNLTKWNQTLGLPLTKSPKRPFPLAVKNLADAG